MRQISVSKSSAMFRKLRRLPTAHIWMKKRKKSNQTKKQTNIQSSDLSLYKKERAFIKLLLIKKN
jgi:hypothetical protein